MPTAEDIIALFEMYAKGVKEASDAGAIDFVAHCCARMRRGLAFSEVQYVVRTVRCQVGRVMPEVFDGYTRPLLARVVRSPSLNIEWQIQHHAELYDLHEALAALSPED